MSKVKAYRQGFAFERKLLEDSRADCDCHRVGVKTKGAATRATPSQIATELLRYFFSSAGFSAGGGAGAWAGGAGVCVAPDMPSLKLRMPSPNPFMISGMRLPPKKISITARTTSQWKMLNSPMNCLHAPHVAARYSNPSAGSPA